MEFFTLPPTSAIAAPTLTHMFDRSVAVLRVHASSPHGSLGRAPPAVHMSAGVQTETETGLEIPSPHSNEVPQRRAHAHAGLWPQVKSMPPDPAHLSQQGRTGSHRVGNRALSHFLLGELGVLVALADQLHLALQELRLRRLEVLLERVRLSSPTLPSSKVR